MGADVTDSGVPAAPLPPAPVADATPATPAATETPSFDWSSWDGSVDSLPETDRDTYRPVVDYYGKRLADNDAERERYERFMATLENDPRIEDLTKKIEAETSAHGLTRKELEARDARIKAAEAEIQAYRDEVAKIEADRFKAAHGEKINDAAWMDTVIAAVDAGWDLDDAARLADLHPDARTVAQQAMKDGAKPSVALEYATLKAPVQKPRVNESADLMAGAESGGRRAEAEPDRMPSGLSASEKMDWYAKRRGLRVA